MVRIYYNLEDFVGSEDGFTIPEQLNYGIEVTDLFKTIAGRYLDTIPTSDPLNQEIINKLFCVYLYPRYKDMYIGYFDLGHDDEDADAGFEKVCKLFMRKLSYIIHDTYDKYTTLIGLFENEKTHLMDDVIVSTESKYNDTPQNAQGNYDWSTDDHLTNINKSETHNPGNTRIGRLNEVEKLLSDYYSMWVEEFRRLFIYE